jgi:hypothetical protein
MPVAFGFSVGDFISAIQLVHQLAEALKSASGSSAQFLELIRELHSLETALLLVKNVELLPSQYPQHVALQQAAVQCQDTIDQFLRKIQKYQPTLRLGGSKNPWTDAVHKIQWSLCRKEDVRTFRSMLTGHTSSINMLLTALQLCV